MNSELHIYYNNENGNSLHLDSKTVWMGCIYIHLPFADDEINPIYAMRNRALCVNVCFLRFFDLFVRCRYGVYNVWYLNYTSIYIYGYIYIFIIRLLCFTLGIILSTLKVVCYCYNYRWHNRPSNPLGWEILNGGQTCLAPNAA